jgi:hypothetical protein
MFSLSIEAVIFSVIAYTYTALQFLFFIQQKEIILFALPAKIKKKEIKFNPFRPNTFGTIVIFNKFKLNKYQYLVYFL